LQLHCPLHANKTTSTKPEAQKVLLAEAYATFNKNYDMLKKMLNNKKLFCVKLTCFVSSTLDQRRAQDLKPSCD